MSRAGGHRGRAFLALAIPLVTLAATQVGCYNAPPDKLAVWSEFLPTGEIRPALSALAERRCELYLAVHPQMLDGELVAFVQDAHDAGVNVRLWLQLPDDGIWLNDTNATAMADFANETLDWIDANSLPVDWLIFDVEPSYDYAEALANRLADEGILGAFDLLQMHRDLAAFSAARETLQDMVASIHARGLRAMAVSLPWVVEDSADGDDDLQDIFDTPFTAIDWDSTSFILYRSSLSELVGIPLSPAFVAEYARRIRSRFGNDAEIAIGTISTPGLITTSGYVDPIDLWLDVMAVRASGLGNISVYSLDGMLVAGGAGPWLDAASGPTVTLPIVDPFAGVVPLLFGGLDALADD